jgi:hypothetical protein
MDRKRIEEFRRKLREGQQVRVVNGQIVMEGGAQPQSKPGATVASQPTVAPQGVQVKPHEWGASDPSSMLASSDGQARALKEQALLAAEYPEFAMDVHEDGTPYVHGWIGPSEQIRGRYQVLVTLPPGYGRGAMPQAFVLEPPLRKGAPHQFVDGSLCLDHSGAFTARSTLVTFLAWVTIWLALYEGWLETGVTW